MYKETYNLNFEAAKDVFFYKPAFDNNDNPELKEIAWTLRHMANKDL